MTIVGGGSSNGGEADDELIVFMLDNVQLMAIENDAASEPTPPYRMIIRRFNPKRLAHAKSSVEIKETKGEASVTGRPPQLHKFHRPPAGSGFIQVGEWVCTLIPGHTVIMKNSFGIYVVPNPTEEHPHMFVGVLLPRGTPADVERAFIAAISQFATVRVSERNDGLSEKLSAHLVTGGNHLAQWIGAAAARADAYLTERAERRRAQSVDDGEPTTTQPKTVNPLIRHGLAFARAGGKRLNNATTALSETVGEIGVGLGKRVVDHVSRHRRDGSTCARLVDNAMTVSRGGLTAAGTVWMSLEDASRTLFRSLADNAARDAEVKHGKEVSESLHNALYAAGHSTMAVYELMELFSPRSVALKIGRKGATQMVRGYHGATATTALVSPAAGGGALVTAFDDPTMMPSTSSSATVNEAPLLTSTKKTL